MIIETERLILRPFLESDAADVFEYLHRPAVHCFACMTLETMDDAKTEMNRRVGETEYYFAITLKESGKSLVKSMHIRKPTSLMLMKAHRRIHSAHAGC